MSLTPPRPKGPHLNALRAFEAAARLGGFSAAAEELCVTPGAVAQHIKAIEEWAHAPLFERRSQGVTLTALGTSVAAEFEIAFDRLGSAQRTLRVNAGQKSINIAALPSVAQLWLSPRLPAIRSEISDHTISITALETPPNLQREMFDMSIFIDEVGVSATATVLADDTIFPVCSPEIAQRLASPSDLPNETLIHDATWKLDWVSWLKHAGHSDIDGKEGPVFSLYSIAVEEARNGAGVLIGHGPLVEKFLASGTLVAPFEERFSSGKSLTLETAEPSQKSNAFDHIVEILTG